MNVRFWSSDVIYPKPAICADDDTVPLGIGVFGIVIELPFDIVTLLPLIESVCESVSLCKYLESKSPYNCADEDTIPSPFISKYNPSKVGINWDERLTIPVPPKLRPEPSPINEPVNEPVTPLAALRLTEPPPPTEKSPEITDAVTTPCICLL